MIYVAMYTFGLVGCLLPGQFTEDETSTTPSTSTPTTTTTTTSTTTASTKASKVDYDADGYTVADGDCDDTSSTIHPGATDLAGDGVDQNCDGVDGVDADGDGWASKASGGDDCDDENSEISPDAWDEYGDAFDSNCDGNDGIDADADGYASIKSGGTDCNDLDPNVYVGADDQGDDDIDQNCDGVDGVDSDGDGFPSTATGGVDCDDSEASTNPDATDDAGDGIDANCDGIDGEDSDGDGHASVDSGGSDCDDSDVNISPSAVDTMGDKLDNNCDGVDGTDADLDGYASEDSGGTDCNDAVSIIYPGAIEVCDGMDGNCDGQTDEGTSCDYGSSPFYNEDPSSSSYGHAYLFITWSSYHAIEGSSPDEQAVCQSMGYDLVVIDDSSEWAFLENSVPWGGSMDVNGEAKIGLFCEKGNCTNSANWYWRDGQPLYSGYTVGLDLSYCGLAHVVCSPAKLHNNASLHTGAIGAASASILCEEL